MKASIHTVTIPIAVFILLGALSTSIIWSPTEEVATWAWNLSIILIPVIALLAQWKFAKERQMPLMITLTVIAILNTSIVIGSRLGAWTGQDWTRALSGNGLPDLPGKTVMGGLLLMLLVYALLQRWWRFSAGMADVLMMGLALGAVIGRIGCLVAGCCFGVPTDSNWGICYGPGTPAFQQQVARGLIAEDALSSTLLFPIQAFFIAGNLVIFTILWHFRKKISKPGALALLGFGLITLQRFGLEFIRDIATNRGSFGIVWAGMKSGQWIMLGLAIGSFIWFYFVQYSKRPKTATSPLPYAGPGPAMLAYALGVITIGGFLLRDLMTLDESMVILFSCLPAVWFLGRNLWKERKSGKMVFAPVSMLSATAILLMMPPIDSLPNKSYPGPWKQWLEIGGAGSFGNYKVISRDCSGDITSVETVNVQSYGVEVNSNWQRDLTHFQVSFRGVLGQAESSENFERIHNYRYSVIGLKGTANWELIGLSLGGFHRRHRYLDVLGTTYPEERFFYPALALRVGRLDKYFFDMRLFDEIPLGFANEPVFSMGLVNLGFGDPSGNSLLRTGFGVSSVGEPSFMLGGQFPFGKSGVTGSLSTYLGHANIVSLGLKYRLGEQ